MGYALIKRVRIHAALSEGFIVEATVRKHKIIMDLPPPLGQDRGPTPVDIMLASLAGCLGAVTRLHAERHGIKIDEMRIVIDGEYDTAGFEGKDVKPGMLSVKAQIIIKSPNSEEELKKFFEFVEKHCPVSDTFTSNTPVEIVVEKR